MLKLTAHLTFNIVGSDYTFLVRAPRTSRKMPDRNLIGSEKNSNRCEKPICYQNLI